MSKLRRSRRVWQVSTIFLLAGCETLPALVQLGVAFGNDMISAAAHNYAPQYAVQVESLFSTIASNITGLEFGAQAASSAADQEIGGYVEASAYDTSEPDLDTQEQTAYPLEPAGNTMATNLMVWRAGANHLSQVNNGDRLVDGGGDPQAGDRLKIHFRTNCECYVYVIGVDSTGYVAQIFPDSDEQLINPVSSNQDYVLPGGDYWWGLDQTSGVEHVYFIASREPRGEIEAALAAITAQPRRAITDQIQPVNEPVLLSTRGLVKVFVPDSAKPTQALVGPEESQVSASLNSEVFTSRNLNDDLMVTKWFYHD